MPYTTLDLLKQRLDPAVLAGLADDVNMPPDLEDAQTTAVIAQAVADGAALIDSCLGAQLDLADSAVRAALERLNATLALYFLYQRRCLDDRLNPLASARELAEAHLRAVASGRAQLGGTLDSAPSKTAWSSTEEREPTVSRETLRGF
jgi:phage gp36-like protein